MIADPAGGRAGSTLGRQALREAGGMTEKCTTGSSSLPLVGRTTSASVPKPLAQPATFVRSWESRFPGSLRLPEHAAAG